MLKILKFFTVENELNENDLLFTGKHRASLIFDYQP